MATTTALAVALGIAGVVLGTYAIYAARTRRLVPRVVSAFVMIGTMAVISAADVSVWVLAGYLVGIALSFVVCDVVLGLCGVSTD